jgi:hypothetical protein
MDEGRTRLTTGRRPRGTRVARLYIDLADGDDTPNSFLGWDAEGLLDRVWAWSLQGGDVAAEAMSFGGEQQAFDKAAVVEDLEIMPGCAAGSDDHQRERGSGRRSRATRCQLLPDLVVANHHDLGCWALLALPDQRPTSKMS